MLLTVKIGTQYLPIQAPLGAAAYIVQLDGNSASVIFAMMRKGEDGALALNKVKNRNDGLPWQAVAGRPEEQHPVSDCGSDFVSYTFTLDEGRWAPASKELASFLSAISALQTPPAVPPKELAYEFGPAKVKKVRSA